MQYCRALIGKTRYTMITNINADIIIAAVQSTTEIRACHTTSSGYSSRSELRNLHVHIIGVGNIDLFMSHTYPLK